MTPPTLIICPACGHDDTDRVSRDGYFCCHCGHVFSVINAHPPGPKEDDPPADG